MKQHLISNGAVKVEALEWVGTNSTLTPLLFVPGMLGQAKSFKSEIEAKWTDRRCISVSLRGRGKSDAPASGFTLDDHASDLEAVVRGLGLTSGFILIAHSRGVPYALRLAEMNPGMIRAMVLLEHPPLHLPIEPSWAERWSKSERLDLPKPDTIWALQREANFRDLHEVLKLVACPKFLVAGGQPGSMLTMEDLKEFSNGAQSCVLHQEEQSGHELETLDLRKLLGPILNT